MALQLLARSAFFPRALQRIAERGFAATTVDAGGVNLSDRKTLKKFIGVTDCLGEEQDARGTLTALLEELKRTVAGLPADADYRRAVEAITEYRLKVLSANPSDAAVEEVLDCHLEEAILETREELRLVPLVAEHKPWDVPEGTVVPVFDYHEADEVLGKSTIAHKTGQTVVPPPPPPPRDQ